MKKYVIAELREARGLTREELANASGVSESTIKKIENGQTTNPHPHNLDRLAAALGTNRSGLTKPPVERAAAAPRPRRRVLSQGQLPSVESVWVDEPGVADEEREHRRLKRMLLDEQWRTVLDMAGREGRSVYPAIEDRTPMRVRREVLEAIASGGVPERVLTALLFAGVAHAIDGLIGTHADDPAAYHAARARLRTFLEQAMDMGELLWIADDFAGGVAGIQIMRDSDAAQLRRYQHCVEAWEVTHAPVILAWAEAGPVWDEVGTRNLLSEVAQHFRAFTVLFGQQMASVMKQVAREADDE
jgi:transcriptional regulator with XRE-family HTH domain